MIEIYQDAELRDKLVEEGRREVDERFNVERVAKDTEDLMNSLAMLKYRKY